MNPLITTLIALAKAQVGTREEGGNNLGPRIKLYQQATWLTPAAWPWCAAFIAYLLMRWTVVAGAPLAEALKIEDDELAGWRCRDAAAFGWLKWAKNKGLTIYLEDKDTDAVPQLAKAGDIVIFDFSHIGLCIKDQLTLTDRVDTIEGNTNGKGDRDSAYGDGVWQKSRRPEEILAYIRILT